MKYPEAELDDWLNISNKKMFGTSMWFMESADELYYSQALIDGADALIALNNQILSEMTAAKTYGNYTKTLEELKKERLKQLEMEE